MKNPFRNFKTSPDFIRLAVMIYIRFSLLLRQVVELLPERGKVIDKAVQCLSATVEGPILARKRH